MADNHTPSETGSRGSSPTRRSTPARSPLSRLADVRPGEGPLVFGAALTLAGIVAAHLMMETARDALFLTKLSPTRLAFVYLAMALMAGLVGRYEITVGRILGRTNALILSLMIAGMGTMLFYVGEKSIAATFALYLWTGLSGTLLMVQFWLFAASRLTGPQGRRLYGLVAAGGVLGAVGGGGLSVLITRSLPVETLLAFAAGLQLATALLVTTAPPPAVLSEPSHVTRARDALRTVGASSYLRRLVALTVVATLTLLCTDYLFKSVTAARVPPDELGSFLANYYTATNAIALVIQVFIAMRVLQRAGTIVALSLLPIFLFAAAGAPFLLGSVLTGALIAKGADGALRHSLHKVSMELLYLPLDAHERSSAKVVIDSLLVRVTQGITALALLGLGTVGLDTPKVLLGSICGGAVLWFACALSLRHPYLERFRTAIGRSENARQIHLEELSLDGVEVVVESLSSTDEARVLSAMSLFEEAGRTGLIPALVLYHPSESIVVRALELIPSHDRKDWPPLAERLVHHESIDIRLAAVRALGRYGHLEKIDPDSYDDPRLRATAIFFQANRSKEPALHAGVRELLDGVGTTSALSALLSAIIQYGSKRWGDVLERLKDTEEPELAALLPQAIVRVQDARFIPILVERLAIREGREEVRKALARMGERSFRALCDALADKATPPELRLHLPRAISRLGTRQAGTFLLDALHSSLPGAIRYKALRGLGHLSSREGQRFPEKRILPLVESNAREALRLAILREFVLQSLHDAPARARASGWLLAELLLDKKGQAVERLTRLLQLLHPREDLRRVYHAIVRGSRAAQTAAGELLEVLTLGYDENSREMVRTLTDPAPTTDRLEHIMTLIGLSLENEADVLRNLLQDPDPPLSALAAEYSEKCEVLEVSVEVQQVMETNPWLRLGFPSERPPAS